MDKIEGAHILNDQKAIDALPDALCSYLREQETKALPPNSSDRSDPKKILAMCQEVLTPHDQRSSTRLGASKGGSGSLGVAHLPLGLTGIKSGVAGVRAKDSGGVSRATYNTPGLHMESAAIREDIPEASITDNDVFEPISTSNSCGVSTYDFRCQVDEDSDSEEVSGSPSSIVRTVFDATAPVSRSTEMKTGCKSPKSGRPRADSVYPSSSVCVNDEVSAGRRCDTTSSGLGFSRSEGQQKERRRTQSDCVTDEVSAGGRCDTTSPGLGFSRSKGQQKQRKRTQTDSPHYELLKTLSRVEIKQALELLATAKGLKEQHIDLLVWDCRSSGRVEDFTALLRGLVKTSTHLLVVDTGRRVHGSSVNSDDDWSPSDDGVDSFVAAGRKALKMRLL